MDIIKSLEWRYACKKFDKDKKLEDIHIDELSKAFNLTATSFGLQPVKLVVIKNELSRSSIILRRIFHGFKKD